MNTVQLIYSLPSQHYLLMASPQVTAVLYGSIFIYFILTTPLLSIFKAWGVKFDWVALQAEKIGNIDEIWWYMWVYFTMVTLTFVNFYFLFLCLKLYIFTTPFFIILFNLFSLLNLYLYMVGSNFISFIRGCGAVCVALYEYILDMSNLLSFVLRLSLQVIRLAIIIGTATTLYQFWNELVFGVDMSLLGKVYTYTLGVLTRMGEAVHYVFEFTHFLIVFGMQTIAFMVMTIWLFQFLYTTYISPLLEA